MHVHHRRRLSGAEDEPAENTDAAWIRNTFYVLLDEVLRSMRNRFDKTLLAMLTIFCSDQFSELMKRFKTAADPGPDLGKASGARPPTKTGPPTKHGQETRTPEL